MTVSPPPDRPAAGALARRPPTRPSVAVPGRGRASTTCSATPPRRPPGCSARTARSCTCSTRRPGRLRFAHDAGTRGIGPDHWIRSQALAIGVGMFGRAVAERRVVVTGDYADDRASSTGRCRTGSSTRSGSSPWSSRRWSRATRCSGRWARSRREGDAFAAPQVGLVRALADHAALAMANARLIEELARSAGGARAPGGHRALAARAGHPDLRRARPRRRRPEHDRRGAPAARRRGRPDRHRRPRGPAPQGPVLGGRGAHRPGGLAGGPRRQARGRRVRPGGRDRRDGDHRRLPDGPARSSTATGPDTYARSKGIAGVIATPLIGDQGPFGAITVWSTQADAFGPSRRRAARDDRRAGGGGARAGPPDRGAQPLAGDPRQARGGRARAARDRQPPRDARRGPGRRPAPDRPRERPAPGRPAGPPRPPGAAVGRDPVGVPRRLPVHGQGRDGAAADRRPGRDRGAGGPRGPSRSPRATTSPTPGSSTTTRATRPSATTTCSSVLAAPVIGEDGLLGVLQAGHRDVGAFGEDELRLIGALAGLASIAVTNARLAERLATSQAALERTADAERALREIARRMMSSQDPAGLLQDVTEEAASLLGSSGAAIQLLDPASGDVRWAHDAGIDPALRDELQAHDAIVDGARTAIRSRRVVAHRRLRRRRALPRRRPPRRLPRGGRHPVGRASPRWSARRRSSGRSPCSPRRWAGSGPSRATCSPPSRTSPRSRSTTRS